MPPRAGRVRPQRPLREHDRIERFQDFDRRDGRGRDRIVGVIETVAVRVAAESAAEEAEHDPASAVGAPAGERQRIDGGERAAVGAFRRGLGEGAEDHVDDAQDRLGIAADRARRRYREQRGVGDDELDRCEATRIGGNVGEEVLECDIATRDGGRIRDVERAVARRRRAREVEPHPIAGDREIERDAKRLVGDAVIVKKVVAAVAAVRQRGDVGPHELLRAQARAHRARLRWSRRRIRRAGR